MPVRVTTPEGDEKTYDKATTVENDGYGDWLLKDSAGKVVATRKRSTVEEIEVL